MNKGGQVLETDADVLRVLRRAREEGWTSLALIGPGLNQGYFRDHVEASGFTNDAVFLIRARPHGRLLDGLNRVTTLTSLCVTECGIGAEGA
jgi:hypothetical protein